MVPDARVACPRRRSLDCSAIGSAGSQDYRGADDGSGRHAHDDAYQEILSKKSDTDGGRSADEKGDDPRHGHVAAGGLRDPVLLHTPHTTGQALESTMRPSIKKAHDGEKEQKNRVGARLACSI